MLMRSVFCGSPVSFVGAPPRPRFCYECFDEGRDRRGHGLVDVARQKQMTEAALSLGLFCGRHNAEREKEARDALQ